jgi:adenylate cyclase
VLEGSVQREGSRVRVNAQLIDAESGAHIWADRFEEDAADLFKLQDEVVARLANTLRYELAEAEGEKAQGSRNPDVVDLAMRGWWEMPSGAPNKEQAAAALPLYERALAIDPDNGEALAGKAQILLIEYIVAPRKDVDYDEAILGLVNKAIARDPANVHAYRAKGIYLSVSGRPADALRVLDAGLAIDPNFAPLLAARSTANYYLGRFAEAQTDVKRAIAVSPRDPSMSQWLNLLADTEIGFKHFDAAADYAKKAIDGGFRSFYSYLNVAVAEGFLGHEDEAKAAVSEALRSKPDLSLKWLEAHKPVLAPAFDVLRKAGMPEE